MAAVRAQPVIRIHGSTTVQAALEPHRAALEAAVGRKIEFSPTGSNAGLASLAAGKSDLAMLSSPLEDIARRLNTRNSGAIDANEFRAISIGQVKIAFIVHPRNPARTLTASQLAEILTGKIKNWKEVGGNDAPVVVVSLANAGSLIRDSLLRGAAITADARLVPNATQIPGVVAQEINGIGIISLAHVKGPTSLVQTDAEIFVPLFLVTRGEPAGAAKILVETAYKLLNRAG
jgi:phosphate transport system substrate-binding protein